MTYAISVATLLATARGNLGLSYDYPGTYTCILFFLLNLLIKMQGENIDMDEALGIDTA